MHGLIQFFSPYIKLCHLASWGVGQNLEGIGLFGYLNNSYVEGIPYPLWNISPAQGVAFITLLYAIFIFCLFLLNVRASFYVGYKIGSISVVTWLTPGFLALSGVPFDLKPLVPDIFRFTTGFPGGIGCAAINLMFFMIFGWSVILLIGSWWSRERIKNLFDHIWYPLGLVAALYFVTDANLNAYKNDFDNDNVKLTQYLTVYSDSLKNMTSACKDSGFISSQAGNLCKLSENLQSEVKGELDIDAKLRVRMGVGNGIKVLINRNDSDLAKSIILTNSWACDEGHLIKKCLKIPIEKRLTDEDFNKWYIFPPSYYAEAIYKYHEALAKTDEKISSIERSFNIRYFAFLGVAFLAGGKVANSTRSLLSADKIRPRSWIMLCIRQMFALLNSMFRLTCSLLKKLVDIYRRYFALGL